MCIRDRLNTKLKEAGVDGTVSTEVKDGKLIFNGEKVEVSAKSTKLGLAMVGLGATQEPKDGKMTASPNLDAAVNFTVSLNGLTRTISLDGIKSDISDDELAKTIQGKIDEAFGNLSLIHI